VEGLCLDPPEGDKSDGYDVSDTEESKPTVIQKFSAGLFNFKISNVCIYCRCKNKGQESSADLFNFEFGNKLFVDTKNINPVKL
jgi:hypothetical protein